MIDRRSSTKDLYPASKNILINGTMNIDQRGTVAPAVGTLAYTLDRWLFSSAGAAVTGVSTNLANYPMGFVSSMKIQGATSVTTARLAQRIESESVPLYRLTFSAWIQHQGASNMTPTFSAYTPAALDSWGTPTLRHGPINLTTVPPNVWTRVVYNFSPAAWTNSWNGLQVELGFPTGFLDSTSKNIFVTGVQLEQGPIATSYGYKTLSEELINCQRYYNRLGGQAYATLGSGFISTTSTALILRGLPTSMRISPTLESATTSAASNFRLLYAGGATVSFTGLAVSTRSNSDIVWFDISGGSGWGANQHVFLTSENNTNSYIGLSAEL